MKDNTPLPPESWKPVPDWEGYYEVSDMGRVRRLLATFGTFAGRILKQRTGDMGYCQVGLYRNSKGVTVRVHSLVCAAFIGPRPPGYHINHKDGIKTNNLLSNLEYVSHKQNLEHASDHGLLERGAARHNAKLSEDDVRTIWAALSSGVPQRQLARQYKVSACAIRAIATGRSWRHITNLPRRPREH